MAVQPHGHRALAHKPSPIRLMIVDDSLVARTILSRFVETRDDFELAAVASTADQALSLLHDTPVDIILLDVQMPGTDGLTAMPMLIERSGGAKVLIVSSSCADGAVASVRALTSGAADTLLKPAAGSLAGEFETTLIDRLTRIGRSVRPSAFASATLRSTGFGKELVPIACLAIGASTGGPHALATFLKALPPELPAPVVITQHLPPLFIPYFADRLREITGRPSRVAEDGAPLVAGEILLAPGDAHMRLAGTPGTAHVRLDRAPASSGCLPSVDPMMESVGAVFGASAVAVMLTGMGRDGVLGAAALRRAGGEVFAQDAETSVVWGMPGAVAEAGLAAAILPPEQIARRIATRIGQTAWR